MKRKLTSVAILFLLFSCNQSEIKNKEIDDKKTDAKNNELKVSYSPEDSLSDLKTKEYLIKLVEGKHKYGGTTKLRYLNTLQTLEETKSIAAKQMWTEDKLSIKLKGLKEFSLGGQIKIDIERSTLEAANTDMFTIIIKDTSNQEIFRKSLDPSVPETPSGNKYWWNLDVLSIDKKIRPPFNVFVVDKLQDSPFKFSVTPK